MKSTLYMVALLLFSVLFLNACKENSTDPDEGGGDTENYFPSSNGNYYKYQSEVTDSNGTKTTGQRSSTFMGTQAFAGVTYQVQVDSNFFGPFTETGTSYFRKTDTGVFFFLDTTGLSATVPDSLLDYITLDAEMRFLSFPVSDGASWPVFKLDLKYSIINLTIVEVTGTYVGKENISLNLNSGQTTKNAAKIRYVLKLQVPNPQNPFQVFTKTFEAHAWLVPGIGIAKVQGNATILGAFGGNGVDFDDTTTVVSQSLIDYSIK